MTSDTDTGTNVEVEVFRVLAVDDDEGVLTEIERQLEPFDIEVLSATRATDAAAILQSTYIDAAIVDISLHHVDSGREVLRLMTRRAPQATAVIATSYTERLGQFIGISAPRVTSIVHKGGEGMPDEWAAGALKDAYADWQARRVNILNRQLVIDLLYARRTRIEGLRDDDETAFELDRLFRKLFGSVATEGLGTAPNVTVRLMPIEREGLSSAITVQAHVHLGNDTGDQTLRASPVVLKIGPRDDIAAEADRYHRFVKYGVPLVHRVELLGHATDQALGVACYSFATQDRHNSLEALDELLRSPDGARDAGLAIYSLFEPEAKSWYSVTGRPIGPVAYVRATYQPNLTHCADALDATLEAIRRRIPPADLLVKPPEATVDGSLTIGQGKLRLPRRNPWGDGRFLTVLPTRLIHGDMHGGNVMVEMTEETVQRVRLIDYRNVGPGPRLTDFVALDASIRLADVQMILHDLGVEHEKDLDEDGFQAAVMMCAGRVRDERTILRAWEGETVKSLTTARWSTASLQLPELARTNFPDLALEEYTTMAVLIAYRHFGLRIGHLGMIRFSAWLSAAYESLNIPPVRPHR